MSRRGISAVVLGLLLLQVAIPILAESGCLESCSDNASAGECSPVCSSCPHSRVALAPGLIDTGIGLQTERASVQKSDTLPTSFPTDILHVPILS